MAEEKISSAFRKARFPAVMALLSFLFFVAAYLFVTLTAAEPQYAKGLLFLLPLLCFVAVMFFTIRGRWKKSVSTVVTIVLIIIMVCAMPIAFVFLSCDAATTVTSDVTRYQRVLQLSGYPQNTLVQNFPAKIPDGAKNTQFSYSPAVMQGGESFDLKFDTDAKTIENDISEFSGKAEWVGEPNSAEAEKHGLFSSAFTSAGYDTLPEGFTVYLFHSEPYRAGDWNHGKISLAAVSKDRNEVIFHAEQW